MIATTITHIQRPTTTIVTQGSPLSALYPLDAGSAEVGTLGFLPMTLSGGDQTTAFTLTGAPGALRRALAAPDGAITGTPLMMGLTSGIKVIELVPTIPASAGGGSATEAYSLRMYLMASISDQRVTIVLTRNADGTNTATVALAGSTVYSETPATLPARIGIALNATASTASVFFDDVELSLSGDAFTPAQLFAAIAVYEQTATPAGDAAKVVGAALVTQAADIIGTNYPVGATDISGAAI